MVSIRVYRSSQIHTDTTPVDGGSCAWGCPDALAQEQLHCAVAPAPPLSPLGPAIIWTENKRHFKYNMSASVKASSVKYLWHEWIVNEYDALNLFLALLVVPLSLVCPLHQHIQACHVVLDHL